MDQSQFVGISNDGHCFRFLLSTNDGIYPTANISLCIWINEIDKVEQALSQLKENSTWLWLNLNPYQIWSFGLCWETRN